MNSQLKNQYNTFPRDLHSITMTRLTNLSLLFGIVGGFCSVHGAQLRFPSENFPIKKFFFALDPRLVDELPLMDDPDGGGRETYNTGGTGFGIATEPTQISETSTKRGINQDNHTTTNRLLLPRKLSHSILPHLSDITHRSLRRRHCLRLIDDFNFGLVWADLPAGMQSRWQLASHFPKMDELHKLMGPGMSNIFKMVAVSLFG
jgi:hypothetical protein